MIQSAMLSPCPLCMLEGRRGMCQMFYVTNRAQKGNAQAIVSKGKVGCPTCHYVELMVEADFPLLEPITQSSINAAADNVNRNVEHVLLQAWSNFISKQNYEVYMRENNFSDC